MADMTVRAEALGILAKSPTALRVPDIFNASNLANSSVVIAVTLQKELLAGRVERSGERGRYAYTITAAGRLSITGNGARAIEQEDSYSTAPATRRAKATSADTPRPPPAVAIRHEATRDRAEREAAARPNTAGRATGTSGASITPPYLVDVVASFGVRLAARAVAEWPEPLEAMPAELRDWCAAHLAALSGVR